jgi:hypothetical protein
VINAQYIIDMDRGCVECTSYLRGPQIWVENWCYIVLFNTRNRTRICAKYPYYSELYKYYVIIINVDWMLLIHENTTQVFKLKENVENFIAAVSEYGVPRHKLFAVNDLFEGANILNSYTD